MTQSIDIEKPKAGKKKFGKGAIAGILGGALVVLGVGLALILLGGSSSVSEDRIERIIDHGTITSGVSVNGIDISGMTGEQAAEATLAIESELLAGAVFELDVDGETTQLDAEYFGLYTDYSAVLETAVAYGRTGSFEQRRSETQAAKSTGMGFEAKVCADEAKVSAAALVFKTEHDLEASSAGYEFYPWGYFEEDGTAYEPDMDEMLTTLSKKKDYEFPEGLARIAEEDMPAQIRYQYYVGNGYYRDKHDGEVYMPTSANIARFKYTEESKGVDIDADGLAQLILTDVEQGQFGVIEVPAQVTHTDTSVEQAKYDTQLLTSWTSYLSHSDTGRVYNVAKLSGIINGVEILPGETWSINDEAGERTYAAGWKDAPGYTDGVPVDQAGGGVCQVSSTLYNAALRAGLEYDVDIVSSRHSTVSDYIPIGLDATISSFGPHLKLTNPFDTPLYIVSYMDGSDKCVTVEIYGTPQTDENGNELIFDFTSKKTYTGENPPVNIVHDTAVTPPPTSLPVPEGGYVEVGFDQPIKKAEVYKTVYDIEGNVVVEKTLYYSHTYPAKTLTIYCNFPLPLVSGDPLVPDPPEDPEGGGEEGGGEGDGT